MNKHEKETYNKLSKLNPKTVLLICTKLLTGYDEEDVSDLFEKFKTLSAEQ